VTRRLSTNVITMWQNSHMTIMDPHAIPDSRAHMDEGDRLDLLRLEMLVAQGKVWDAQEAAEDLWRSSQDAHKELFHGISNALTAACAQEAGQPRGSREILERTIRILEPYPRRVLGLDLDALIRSVHEIVNRGEGPVRLVRQG
jgi:predicted metal-dependent hydrolase